MASKARILVVEDDAMIRELLEIALKDEGYGVRLASQGQQALDVMSAWTPDVVLLDLMLPVMDGWEFIRERDRRGIAPDARIIALSASRPTAEERSDRFAAVILKPFDLNRLLGTIEELAGQT